MRKYETRSIIGHLRYIMTNHKQIKLYVVVINNYYSVMSSAKYMYTPTSA